MGLPVLRRMHAASDVGVAESGMKSLVSQLLVDTCRGGHGEADIPGPIGKWWKGEGDIPMHMSS